MLGRSSSRLRLILRRGIWFVTGQEARRHQAEERRLQAEILSAERLEESAICQAASDGIDLPRRPNASPMAVLGLQSEENQ